MAMLTKKDILAANDKQVEKHVVPEWGGEVYLRSLRGWERDKFDQDVLGSPDKTHARAKLVAMCLCDDQGESLGFTEEDTLALSEKSAKPLDRLFAVACKMSGLSKQDVEEIEKNLPDQSSASG